MPAKGRKSVNVHFPTWQQLMRMKEQTQTPIQDIVANVVNEFIRTNRLDEAGFNTISTGQRVSAGVTYSPAALGMLPLIEAALAIEDGYRAEVVRHAIQMLEGATGVSVERNPATVPHSSSKRRTG